MERVTGRRTESRRASHRRIVLHANTLGGLLAALWVTCGVPRIEAGDLPATEMVAHSVPGSFDSLEVLEAGFANAGPRAATVALSKTADGYQVDASCAVRATRATAWSVLTDYEGIDRFVPSMKVSRVLSRAKDHAMVEQVATARVLLFGRKMRVVLDVREQAPDSIRFVDVEKKDFLVYHGWWRIESRGTETRVIYRVTAKPRFSVPDFVLRSALRSSIQSLLTDVGMEIEHRAAMAAR